MSDKPLSISEIVARLKEVERHNRPFRDALAMAEGLQTLDARKNELEKNIDHLTNFKSKLMAENAAIQNDIALAQDKAKAIVVDADEKAAKLIAEAQEKILVAETRSAEEIEDAVKSLVAVKEEVQEAMVERDQIKADIKELQIIKEKTRDAVLNGVA